MVISILALLLVVALDIPRKETGVLSIAQFQHAKLSEFAWHPMATHPSHVS